MEHNVSKLIEKALLAAEDMDLGAGTSSQVRQGQVVTTTRIDASWVMRTRAQIRALDINRITQVTLVNSLGTVDFLYKPDLEATDDDNIILKPNDFNGSWIMTGGQLQTATVDRPQLYPIFEHLGMQFFDVTINKPIYWTGSIWVDALGVQV